jgi:hypothetical protein
VNILHRLTSEQNNKVFGQPQSFVAGSPTNIQFMVKDSKKYDEAHSEPRECAA